MRMFRLIVVAGALLALPGAASAAEASVAPRRHDVAVVVNSRNPARDISLKDIKRLYQGEKRFWGNDQPVALISPPAGSPVRELLLRKVYEMSEAQYKKYWIARIFRDEASAAPRVLVSVREALALVGSNPGAIALVDADSVGQARVLKVEGKLPKDPGYPLK